MKPELFIRRPVLTTLLMAAIMIFGVMAYRLLPVNDLPNVDYIARQLQQQTDAVLGRAGARVLLGAVVVN